MNKTVIQYRNKTISHYHDHAHDHVHLHGLGDWASLLIAVIVMVGIIIAVIAVACLVSTKNVISLGAEKYKKRGSLSRQATLAYKPVHLLFHSRHGRGSAATCDKPLGSDSRTVPLRWRGSDKRGGGIKSEARGDADINHSLGYINNIGLPVTGKHTRTIFSFLTHERIITKIIAFYNV